MFTDEFSGATVRNAIRVHSQLKNKWYVFCCKSEDEKLRWMLKFRSVPMSDGLYGICM